MDEEIERSALPDGETFERVRREVASDLRAVKPLWPAWRTAWVTAPLALFVLGAVLLLYGLRPDAGEVGFWALWVPTASLVAVAYFVVYFALLQRAPDSTVTLPQWGSLLAAAVVVQVGGAYLTLLATRPPALFVPLETQAMCFVRISALGAPATLAVLWLLARGLPLRPWLGGLLAGAGGGFLSEGIYRVQCGLSNPGHVLPWHTGSVIFLGLVGLAAGLAWEWRRLPRRLG
jgi:hypothetical protein